MGQLNRMGQISPLMEILSSLAARAKPLELGVHGPATSAVRSAGPPGCCVDYVTVSVQVQVPCLWRSEREDCIFVGLCPVWDLCISQINPLHSLFRGRVYVCVCVGEAVTKTGT